MNSRTVAFAAAAIAIIAALAAVPLFASGYHLALGISLLYFTVLATAWALFSGPTHYISLATAAFFGIGAYTTAVLTELLPWPLVLVAAAAVGVVVALDRRPVDAAACRASISSSSASGWPNSSASSSPGTR